MRWLLLALERALKKKLPGAEKLRIAAEVGSDLPLFLFGGTVLGVGRGEEVYPLPDLPSVCCVVATPEIGVSTPKAFADWDAMTGAGGPLPERARARLESGRPEAPARPARTAEGGRPHASRGGSKLTPSPPPIE